MPSADPVVMRTCTWCDTAKPLEANFHRNGESAGGWTPRCKSCTKASQSSPDAVARREARQSSRSFDLNATRECTKCGVPKPLSDFHADGRFADGHKRSCKACALTAASARQKARWAAGLTPEQRDPAVRAKRNSQRNARRQSDPEGTKARTIYSRYRVTERKFAEMLAAQGGVCAMCAGLLAPPHVDHDHSCCAGKRSCGKCVRGLLCGPCNRALGLLRDNPETMERAAVYLRSAKMEEN